MEQARFYGSVVTKTGRIKRFGWSLIFSSRMSSRTKHAIITLICNKMKYDKEIPVHKSSQVFPSFRALIAVPWVKVRKVRNYDVVVLS